jgi:hypothetical protein
VPKAVPARVAGQVSRKDKVLRFGGVSRSSKLNPPTSKVGNKKASVGDVDGN